MTGPTAVLRKFFTMFIDDRNFALSIVGWLLLYWLTVPSRVASPVWQAVILFAGLAVILLGSLLRHARN